MRKFALIGVLFAALAIPPASVAHNAAHIILPDGTCLDVGSNDEAPIVGVGNPNQNAAGQLDMIPGPGDQYGARWAAENSPQLLPGNCPR